MGLIQYDCKTGKLGHRDRCTFKEKSMEHESRDQNVASTSQGNPKIAGKLLEVRENEIRFSLPDLRRNQPY